MTKFDDGGSVFPVVNEKSPNGVVTHPGISLLDFCTVAVMASLVSSSTENINAFFDKRLDLFAATARFSRKQAEAMIAEKRRRDDEIDIREFVQRKRQES
jgi:hypothetical protein